MYNSDTEILFPLRVIPDLRLVRGDEWQKLVELIIKGGDKGVDRLGFSLMMVRLCGCISCSTHSFRATRGCTLCSQQTIRRFRGNDVELINQFKGQKKR